MMLTARAAPQSPRFLDQLMTGLDHALRAAARLPSLTKGLARRALRFRACRRKSMTDVNRSMNRLAIDPQERGQHSEPKHNLPARH